MISAAPSIRPSDLEKAEQTNPPMSISQTRSKMVQLLSKYHQGVKLGILTTLYQSHHDEGLEYKPMKLTTFLKEIDSIIILDGRVYLVDAVPLTPENTASLEAVKLNLAKLLAKMSLGIHLRNLENAYKKAYHQELDYECFGFPSLADLVESVPDIHIARKPNQKKYALVTIQNAEGNKKTVSGAPVKVEKMPVSANTNTGEQTPPSLAAATFSFEGSDADEEQQRDVDACSSASPGIKSIPTSPSASIYSKAKASPSPEHPCFNVFGWLSGSSNGRKLLMSP